MIAGMPIARRSSSGEVRPRVRHPRRLSPTSKQLSKWLSQAWPSMASQLRKRRQADRSRCPLNRVSRLPSESWKLTTAPSEVLPLLWITPATGGAAPVCEGIIKGATAGTPDPISGHRRPSIGTPSAVMAVRPPERRNPSALPLTEITGRRAPASTGNLVPARSAPIHLHNTGRRTRPG
jgi:hypothetical protein